MELTVGASPPSLPLGSTLTYLDEGAANVVYQITTRPLTPPPTILETYEYRTPPPTDLEFEETTAAAFQGKLLRLRKNLPTTAPCRVAQSSWERFIKPLFNSNEIVDQTLVQLDPTLIERLNTELRKWECSGEIGGQQAQRLMKRQGTYIAKDEHGLLVTDMTPGYAGQYFVEFKPKWLVQSPSAPANSKRCRTCALAARTKALRKPGELLKSPVCPLDLISSNPEDIRRAARLLPESAQVSIERFERWLHNTQLLKRLRDLQHDLDRKGIMDTDVDDSDLLVAMTLRDCTVFVRFPENTDHDDWAIEARIGDLDLKSKGKYPYWKSVELALLEEGWYEGSEKRDAAQPLTCALSKP